MTLSCWNNNMKHSLSSIYPIPSSHKDGLERVLLAAEESGCAITQIAITKLKVVEVAKAHVHDDMMERFYVMSGVLKMVLEWQCCALRSRGFCVGKLRHKP